MKPRAFLFLPLLALVGCGGSTKAISTPNLTFSAGLTSQSTVLKNYNGGQSVSGWNRVSGSSSVSWPGADPSATVELLASVAYTNGNGPFFGFINITTADGSLLVLRMEGNASLPSGTTTTQFTGALTVLGGQGAFANAKGSGTMTGSRDSALGGPVELSFALKLGTS